DGRDEIGTDRRDRLLAELHLSTRDEHAVRQHHHERGDEEPRSRRQRPHEQEEGGDVALGPRPEANAQVIVDRVHLEGVVGPEEDIADDDAPDDEAQHELHVGEALVGVALDGRTEEGRRAGFRRDDGRHRGPPRHATPSERIVVQALLPPSRIQPDGGDGDKIEEDDESVDQKPPVRGSIPSGDSVHGSSVLRFPYPCRVPSNRSSAKTRHRVKRPVCSLRQCRSRLTRLDEPSTGLAPLLARGIFQAIRRTLAKGFATEEESLMGSRTTRTRTTARAGAESETAARRAAATPLFHMLPGAPKPVAPYSHAVEVEGWVFLTGQIPNDPRDDRAPLPEGIEAQTRQTMENLTRVLAGLGRGLAARPRGAAGSS